MVAKYTLLLYKNVVFLAQLEYSYSFVDFRLIAFSTLECIRISFTSVLPV